MNATSLAEFNALKAAAAVALYPATIKFTKDSALIPWPTYVCSFGEVRGEGGLHESGQAMQYHRNGALYFPRTAGYAPQLAQTFIITACAQDAALVGTTWQLDTYAAAAHEPVLKFNVHKTET